MDRRAFILDDREWRTFLSDIEKKLWACDNLKSLWQQWHWGVGLGPAWSHCTNTSSWELLFRTQFVHFHWSQQSGPAFTVWGIRQLPRLTLSCLFCTNHLELESNSWGNFKSTWDSRLKYKSNSVKLIPKNQTSWTWWPNELILSILLAETLLIYQGENLEKTITSLNYFVCLCLSCLTPIEKISSSNVFSFFILGNIPNLEEYRDFYLKQL